MSVTILLQFLKAYWKEIAAAVLIGGLLTANYAKSTKITVLEAQAVVYEMSVESLKTGVDYQNKAIEDLRLSSESFQKSFDASRVEVDRHFEDNRRYIKKLSTDIIIPEDCAGVNDWLIEKGRSL